MVLAEGHLRLCFALRLREETTGEKKDLLPCSVTAIGACTAFRRPPFVLSQPSSSSSSVEELFVSEKTGLSLLSFWLISFPREGLESDCNRGEDLRSSKLTVETGDRPPTPDSSSVELRRLFISFRTDLSDRTVLFFASISPTNSRPSSLPTAIERPQSSFITSIILVHC